MEALGIDIGGSAIKGAPVDTRTGRLLAKRHRIPTPEPLTPGQMAKAVKEIAADFSWKGPIGVGFPGVIQGSHIRTSANLHKAFIDCDGGKLFSKAVARPVALINDAAAAGLAEMKFGAGRDFEGKVLLLTLGTGVGSALFSRGVIFPAELGHLPFKGRSAEKYVSAAVREKKNLGWKEWSGRLDRYIRVLETLLWPELIIVGGGVSAKHRKFFPYLKTNAKLVPAEFFNESGIVGAALWAEENA